MKINLKRAKDCKVQMSVEVDAQTVEIRYLEIMKEFQRAARIPGFREGKAPVELVEKRYKDEARDEVLKSLIPEIYHQSIETEKLSPVSLPKISEVKYERGQKLAFYAEFEESPEISLKNYKGISLKRESSEVSADEIEKGIQSFLESRATFDAVLEIRSIQQSDFIVADVEIWKDGAYRPGRNGVLIAVEQNEGDDFYQKVVGAKPEDAVEVSRDGQPYTRLKIKSIQKKNVPVLDDELAKAVGRQSAAEIREAVQKELGSYKQSDSMEKMKQQLFQKLLKSANFALPESLIERQKERLIEQTQRRFAQMGTAEENWKSELPELEKESLEKAKEQVKLYFILNRIAELEKIELDEAELELKLKSLCEQSGRPLEEVRRVFEEDLRESLREKKTVDFLIANAKFEE